MFLYLNNIFLYPAALIAPLLLMVFSLSSVILLAYCNYSKSHCKGMNYIRNKQYFSYTFTSQLIYLDDG